MSILRIDGGVRSSVVLVALFTLVAVLVRRLAPTQFARAADAVASPKARWGASVVVLLGFVTMLGFNTLYAGYFDHGESTIASVSWLASLGKPLYHGLDSPDRYALQYGPLYYLPFSTAMWAFGPTILSLKALILAAHLGFLLLLWRSYRTLCGDRTALVWVALVVASSFLLRPSNILFQIRADVFLMLSVALGLHALVKRGAVAAFSMSVAIALAVGVKFTACVYFVPLLCRLWQESGPRKALAVALGAGAMGLLPFALPNVSLHDYLQWIIQCSHHPLSRAEFSDTAKMLAVLLLPAVLIVGPTPWRDEATVRYVRDNRFPLLGLAVSLAATVAISSKVGSGSHHLLPFLPLLGYEYGRLWMATQTQPAQPSARSSGPSVLLRYMRSCIGLMVAIRIVGVLPFTLTLWRSNWQWARSVTADLSSILERHPGKRIEMGYGDGRFVESYGGEPDPTTFFRLPLVVASGHITVDEVALDDMQISGVPIPQGTIDELAACSTKIWLIPKGEAPFSLENAYSYIYPELFAARPLFGAEFRDVFARTYRRGESSEYFELWECGGPEG